MVNDILANVAKQRAAARKAAASYRAPVVAVPQPKKETKEKTTAAIIKTPTPAIIEPFVETLKRPAPVSLVPAFKQELKKPVLVSETAAKPVAPSSAPLRYTCPDYTAALIKELRAEGIPAVPVMGSIGGGKYHSWVQFTADGKTYDIDPQGGDIFSPSELGYTRVRTATARGITAFQEGLVKKSIADPVDLAESVSRQFAKEHQYMLHGKTYGATTEAVVPPISVGGFKETLSKPALVPISKPAQKVTSGLAPMRKVSMPKLKIAPLITMPKVSKLKASASGQSSYWSFSKSKKSTRSSYSPSLSGMFSNKFARSNNSSRASSTKRQSLGFGSSYFKSRRGKSLNLVKFSLFEIPKKRSVKKKR